MAVPPNHDDGLFVRLYADYADAAEARVRERELYESVCGPLPPGFGEPAEEKAADAEAEAVEPASMFQDALFVDNTALYRNPFQPPRGALPPELLEWNSVAAREVEGLHSPKLMGDSGTPNPGVVQGALKDCWLIGALAALASKPELVDALFASTELASRGLYTVRLFKNGQPRYVHVDDRLPCNRAGRVHFARSVVLNEPWVALVEKAYAKLHGNYENLTHGTVEQGLRDLTGWPAFKFEMVGLEADGAEALWDRLQLLFSMPQQIVTAEWQKTDSIPAHGVLAGHAYTVLEVRRVQAEATAEFDAVDLRLVKLRNPWGKGAWTGNWSLTSQKWTDYPEIKRKLTAVPGEEDEEPPSAAASEGMDPEEEKEEVPVCQSDELWMEFEDFVAHFTHTGGCFDPRDPDPEVDGHHHRYRGEWIPGDLRSGCAGGPAHTSWPQNPQYAFELDQPTNVAVNLAVVPDPRWQDMAFQGTPAFTENIGFVVMALTGTKNRSTKFHPKKMRGQSWAYQVAASVSGVFTLQPGRYVVVPSTLQPQSASAKFVLELFANRPVLLETKEDTMPEVDDLQESDDEELGTFDDAGVSTAEPATLDPENEGKELEALAFQAKDLADWIKGLAADVTGLEERMAKLAAK